MRRLAPLLAVALTAAAAAAQPTPPVQPAPTAADDRLPHTERRVGGLPPSATAALLASGGATAGLAGLGALVAGGDGEMAAVLVSSSLVVGPSAGNLWLGEEDDALTGFLIRTAGAGAMAYALSGFDVVAGGGSEADVYVFLAGATAYLVGLGYDLRTQYVNGTAARVRVQSAGAGLAVVMRL